MPTICPTITASQKTAYDEQITKVKDFARRLHIDLMDGQLAPSRSIKAEEVWWPDRALADIHIMFRRPNEILNSLINLRPHLIIIHAEAEIDHEAAVGELNQASVKAGLAVLPATSVTSIARLIPAYDHILIFGGHLGYQGGQADLELLNKVTQIRQINSSIEIAWDGGINDQNIKTIAGSGVDVLDVGSYIQNQPDPSSAYAKLLTSLNS